MIVKFPSLSDDCKLVDIENAAPPIIFFHLLFHFPFCLVYYCPVLQRFLCHYLWLERGCLCFRYISMKATITSDYECARIILL